MLGGGIISLDSFFLGECLLKILTAKQFKKTTTVK